MALIAVDIDDTLYSFSEAARDECLSRGHDVAAYTQWNDWRAPVDMLGPDEWADVIKSVHTHRIIRSRRAFPGASEILWGLHEAGHDIFYISTRSPDTAGATRDWLSENFFPRPKRLVATLDDKQQYLESAEFLIDDRPKTLVQYCFGNYSIEELTKRPRAFALQTLYNHNLTDVPGIFVSPTWRGFAKGFRKAGLLDS
ncbi:MAG: 5' nucleotidase, NT5C type [Pyrinomonadaceae bacterium]